jgi:hypothetical protein
VSVFPDSKPLCRCGPSFQQSLDSVRNREGYQFAHLWLSLASPWLYALEICDRIAFNFSVRKPLQFCSPKNRRTVSARWSRQIQLVCTRSPVAVEYLNGRVV